MKAILASLAFLFSTHSMAAAPAVEIRNGTIVKTKKPSMKTDTPEKCANFSGKWNLVSCEEDGKPTEILAQTMTVVQNGCNKLSILTDAPEVQISYGTSLYINTTVGGTFAPIGDDRTRTSQMENVKFIDDNNRLSWEQTNSSSFYFAPMNMETFASTESKALWKLENGKLISSAKAQGILSDNGSKELVSFNQSCTYEKL